MKSRNLLLCVLTFPQPASSACTSASHFLHFFLALSSYLPLSVAALYFSLLRLLLAKLVPGVCLLCSECLTVRLLNVSGKSTEYRGKCVDSERLTTKPVIYHWYLIETLSAETPTLLMAWEIYSHLYFAQFSARIRKVPKDGSVFVKSHSSVFLLVFEGKEGQGADSRKENIVLLKTLFSTQSCILWKKIVAK